MEPLTIHNPQLGEFSGKLLTWARESRGLTQTELANRISATQGYVSKLEDGLQWPSTETIWLLQNALGYPSTFYFTSGALPRENPGFFRRHLTLRASLLKQATARMKILRRRLLRLLESVDGPAVNLPRLNLDRSGGGPAGVAREIRSLWKVPAGPIDNVVKIVENAGCFIIPFDFGTPKIAGFSEWIDQVPIIFVNFSVPTCRARATIAHELGHLIIHCTENPNAEAEAFRFAGEFLVPEMDIKSSLLPLSLDRLARLKLKWKVSMQMLLKRAEEIQIASPRLVRYHWMLMSKAGFRDVEPYDYEIPREEPSLFRELIDTHLNDMGKSKEQLASKIWASESELEIIYRGRPQLDIVR